MTKSKGFSFIEIMIAVAILAAGFVILMSAQGTAFLSSGRAEKLTTATLLAQQKMAEFEMEIEKDIEKGKFPRDDTSENGEFDKPFEEYRWATSVKKVEVPVGGGSEGGEENAMMEGYMNAIMEQISNSVREVKVVIYWGDRDEELIDQPQMEVVTHIVKLK